MNFQNSWQRVQNYISACKKEVYSSLEKVSEVVQVCVKTFCVLAGGSSRMRNWSIDCAKFVVTLGVLWPCDRRKDANFIFRELSLVLQLWTQNQPNMIFIQIKLHNKADYIKNTTQKYKLFVRIEYSILDQ